MSERAVEIVGYYQRVSKTGRGYGLLYRELKDVETGEVLRRRRSHVALRRFAKREGWSLV